jgi:hypothetical protein
VYDRAEALDVRGCVLDGSLCRYTASGSFTLPPDRCQQLIL